MIFVRIKGADFNSRVLLIAVGHLVISKKWVCGIRELLAL